MITLKELLWRVEGLERSRRLALRSAAAMPSAFMLQAKGMYYYGSGAGAEEGTNVAGYLLPQGIMSEASGIVPLPVQWAGKKVRVTWLWRLSGAVSGNITFGPGLRRLKSLGSTETSADVETATVTGTHTAAVNTVYVTSWDAAALPADVGQNEYLRVRLRRAGNTDGVAVGVYLMGVSIALR